MTTQCFTWNIESAPTWDAGKRRIVGGAPAGAFDIRYEDGQSLPGEWWSAKDDAGVVVGYGWLDLAWGDAEILLAADRARQGQGVGTFVLKSLEREAVRRGVNYVFNTVRPEHPHREVVQEWLRDRGFLGNEEGRTLRKRVGAAAEGAPHTGALPAFDAAVDMPPGREESGGYVDPVDQRY